MKIIQIQVTLLNDVYASFPELPQFVFPLPQAICIHRGRKYKTRKVSCTKCLVYIATKTHSRRRRRREIHDSSGDYQAFH